MGEWLCQKVDEQEDRLQRLELMLSNLGIVAGKRARLHGSTWEVSENQIANWVAGTTLPLSDSSEYARFKDGSLEIRGGSFSIQTAPSGARMELTGDYLKTWNSLGDVTFDLDFTTGNLTLMGTIYSPDNYIINTDGIYIESYPSYNKISFVKDIEESTFEEMGYLLGGPYSIFENTLMLYAEGSTNTEDEACIFLEAIDVSGVKKYQFSMTTKYEFARLDYEGHPLTTWEGDISTGYMRNGMNTYYDQNVYVNIGPWWSYKPGVLSVFDENSDVWAIGGNLNPDEEGQVYFVDNKINAAYYKDTDDATLILNALGYEGGITRYRDLRIQDGKGNDIIFVDGSSGNIGIGRPTPTVKLDLVGDVRVFDGSLYAWETATGSNHRFQIWMDTTNSLATINATYGSGAWPISFQIGNSEKMRINTNGYVAIGGSSPEEKLEVQDTTYPKLQVNAASGGTKCILGSRYQSGAHYGWVGSLTSTMFYVGAVSYGVISINTSKNVGIGTTSIHSMCTVAGAITPSVDNTYDLGSASYRWDDVYATNPTIQTSDERMKENIVDSDLGLDFIKRVRPVSFKWKDKTESYKVMANLEEGREETVTKNLTFKRKHYGMVAQQVKEVLGDKDFAGFIYDKDTDMYGLRYGEFIAPMIKAIQELSAKVEELERRVSR